jgi:hypothetical protein
MNSCLKRAYLLGLFLLLCAGPAPAMLINGSFESQSNGLMPNGTDTSRHEEWGMPDDWAWRNYGATNAHGIRYDYQSPNGKQIGWSSDGDWSLYMFASTANDHVAGDYIEFYQLVDLSDISLLVFDAFLKGGEYTNSYVAIDDLTLWEENEVGFYRQGTDVSSFSGLHEIRVGVRVFEAFGDDADGLTYFDNIRAFGRVPVPAPATLLLCMAAFGLLIASRRHRFRPGA